MKTGDGDRQWKRGNDNIDPVPYHLAEQRIAQLTLVFGAFAAVGGWLLFSIRIGAGVLIGTLLRMELIFAG